MKKPGASEAPGCVVTSLLLEEGIGVNDFIQQHLG